MVQSVAYFGGRVKGKNGFFFRMRRAENGDCGREERRGRDGERHSAGLQGGRRGRFLQITFKMT